MYRIQSSNYRSGRVCWRPRPSLAKCLFIRKKLPFFSSSSPSLPLPFSSSDREKEDVDGGREIARTRRTRPRHERAHWKGADAVNLIQVLIGHGNRETTNEERGGIEGNKEKKGRRKEREKKVKRLPLGGPPLARGLTLIAPRNYGHFRLMEVMRR